MTHTHTHTPMQFPAAAELDIASACAAELIGAWHAYAGQISFHHADDSGGEWRLVGSLRARARLIEMEMRNCGLDRPTGEYLMTAGDRIDWETGDWSPGWDWKKAKAANGRHDMTLEQSLRDLLVKHDLRSIQIEVSEYSDFPKASVFWNDATADYGCRMAETTAETFAEALTKGIAIANEQRSITHVVLPDSPLCVEVGA